MNLIACFGVLDRNNMQTIKRMHALNIVGVAENGRNRADSLDIVC